MTSQSSQEDGLKVQISKDKSRRETGSQVRRTFSNYWTLDPFTGTTMSKDSKLFRDHADLLNKELKEHSSECSCGF